MPLISAGFRGSQRYKRYKRHIRNQFPDGFLNVSREAAAAVLVLSEELTLGRARG
jgi:hypothetical protein